MPESVPILCVAELIELPFLPRTTEAQETLGPKPQTIVLCLRGTLVEFLHANMCDFNV